MGNGLIKVTARYYARSAAIAEAIARRMARDRALRDPYAAVEELRQQQGGRCTCGKCEHSR